MENEKHYLRVGSFVLITAALLTLFAVWLAGYYNKSEYVGYRIHFAESVSGLDVGGAVKFRGVKVGKVESLTINQEDTHLIDVDIRILKTTPVKVDSKASLKLQGITGGIFVELSSGTQESALLPGSRSSTHLPEIGAEQSTLATIMDILPAILQKISHIAEQGDKMFNDKNIAAFSATMQNLQSATHDVSQLTRTVKQDPTKLVFPPKEKGIPAP